ncbi:MAG: hypothetical protein M0T77_01350 [Actinomycetota bacterium]|nr:hypothetical protein [Actinomycetota bacterium]
MCHTGSLLGGNAADHCRDAASGAGVHHSAADAGLVAATGTIALFGSGVLAGPVVDRFDRRWLIAACESVRLILYGGLGAAVLEHAVTLTLLMGVQFVGGLV